MIHEVYNKLVANGLEVKPYNRFPDRKCPNDEDDEPRETRGLSEEDSILFASFPIPSEFKGAGTVIAELPLPGGSENQQINTEKESNMENELKTNEHCSTELGKLFEALAKAQLEMSTASKDSKNPFFKSRYADLSAVVKASRPSLAKNGLCVLQKMSTEQGVLYLSTRLGHSSGQWIESAMPINPPKQDIQSLGSYITYLRRYAYSSLVGVAPAGEDDDGEAAMATSRGAAKVVNDKISRAQLDVLSGALDPDMVDGVLKGYSISKLADLPAKAYSSCLERAKEIKKAKGS